MSSYSTTALLKLYGSKAVNVTDVIQHFYPDAGAPKPSNPQDLQIGKEYVPPLGGISIIDPDHVVEPGYANRLRQAGYRPNTQSHDVQEGDKVWLSLGLVCIAVGLGVVVITALSK